MFEVQRVVKKLKAAVGEEEQTGLETQLEALKEISHGVVAALAIRSKLAKAKLLPKSLEKADSAAQYPLMTMVQELQDLVAGGGETVSHPGAEKATAKLLSNKAVSEEVSKAVKDLRTLFEERLSTRREGEAKSAGRSAGKEDHNVGRQEAKNDDDGREGDRLGRRDAEVTTEAGGSSNAERVHNAQSRHTSTANGKRGADQDRSGEGRPRKQVRIESEDESGTSKGEDSNEGESTGDSEQDGGEHGGDSDADLSRLPALSTGFVAGRGLRLGRASDEEWSDGDADSIDEGADVAGTAKESKKNRMGQRARRA